jgi:hypothetical protein
VKVRVQQGFLTIHSFPLVLHQRFDKKYNARVKYRGKTSTSTATKHDKELSHGDLITIIIINTKKRRKVDHHQVRTTLVM